MICYFTKQLLSEPALDPGVKLPNATFRVIELRLDAFRHQHAFNYMFQTPEDCEVVSREEDDAEFEDGELISPMVEIVFTVLLFLLLPCAVLCIFAMLMYSSFKKVKLQKKVDKSESAGLRPHRSCPKSKPCSKL